ncbi:MAG TPA: ribose 5-phosphate isomerase A [Methanothermobacter sp.]|uniref:Ribose-5-phosphate isomerase A n=1 Tax=Methanothermobacter tenebrarum TaxID=680118 RepID=A0ABM7YCR9_9EURY|nr:ribose 5-phosphate isomerase A [Methanothermobacter tenebrarum]MDD3454307.1 ribose 5-phosphate isomerase A [Methanobacteriales archaeon]MDX9692557.1 ribose 5-phosphate isomerase A [Methanothermobacter sp.]BDH79280.1 ribose 5-phosphate isomerase A [Methanothermobacter tenebrarum]HHW16193.1 ribose 5-phosphate isomerase A [Methanothermobacter sp.]HOQ20057.1 ribose 5-phosphate isomerase A [Methanothermobacter sp.]
MNLKKMVAYKVAEEIRDGQVVGLGTGSTARYFIERVGMRIEKEELDILGVPTSYQSLFLARDWEIPITSIMEHDVDVAVDGADEVDKNLNLLKGGGAAHTQEKIIDYSASEFIVIVDDSKLTDKLKRPVPVEVIPASSRLVCEELNSMGAEVKIRMSDAKDGPLITDNGNFVIDADFGPIDDPPGLEYEINNIPGVLENGIFSRGVDRVIVGTRDGIIEL